ncbi:hypothetical protein HPB48_006342 [Haemaphysalis longicornis]|uniref:Uncharacterized protein n=1 Tax=Haemaphysalis longicornis TaxID=44386 RepID=A0A9J6GLD0_HAELO|nr:hypothetical protein HPB48_006342 [Haemaphysalis longicornis]
MVFRRDGALEEQDHIALEQISAEAGDDGVNPAPVLGEVDVDARHSGLAAPDAPGHQSDRLPRAVVLAHQRAAAVSLQSRPAESKGRADSARRSGTFPAAICACASCWSATLGNCLGQAHAQASGGARSRALGILYFCLVRLAARTEGLI